ncbi:MAG TPA: hypothetical protein VLJ68_02590 [Chitinophagaceae bacterium]|nr:hypothetical protein [Chitinophagaceae bacterium]
MRILSAIGRIFYASTIIVMGAYMIYYRDFPYMLIPPKHQWIPGLVTLAYVFGALFILAGACIAFEIKTRSISLILGTLLLLIFCFYFIPYELIVSPAYMQFGDWENSAKELALAGGAFVIGGCFPKKNETALTQILGSLIPLGTILFSLTIISFGIDHFLYAKEAADYVPSWIPWHLFWIYFCGTALLGAGLAILFKIKREVAAALLGTMILIWFIILHTPRMISSPLAYLGSEVTSAFIALAYSGIAFVIAGGKRQQTR